MDQTELADKTFLWHQRQCRENQIWIAICVYVLAAIVRKELRLNLACPKSYRF